MPKVHCAAALPLLHAAVIAAATASSAFAQAPSTSTTPDGRGARRRPEGCLRRACRSWARTPSRSRRPSRARSSSSTRASTSRTASTTPRPAARSRSGATRSRLRDGLLGPGPGARAQHQRGDGSERRAEGPGARPEGVSLWRAGRPRERDYIDALAKRYTGKPDGRPARDRAFADAMKAVAKKYPRDLDAATLYAEAVMDLRPWNYWTRDGMPHEGTGGRSSRCSSACCGATPSHPGALHYWIHLWEPTKDAGARRRGRGPAADADAGRGSHRPHARAHLPPRRALRRRGPRQPARGPGRRGLHRPVPGAGPVPHELLPAQPALRLVGPPRWTAERSGDRGGAQAPRRFRRDARAAAVAQGFLVIPVFALVRFGRWDEMLPSRSRRTTRSSPGHLALRARVGVPREGPGGRREGRAGRASQGIAGPELDAPFSRPTR